MNNRILVVEDNLLNRELLCDWLDMEGFCVLAATNLDEAYGAFANDDTPEAVLLDVQLGKEDGLELAAWIRNNANFRSLPVIAVTAHAMVTEQQRVLQAGCNACISKPIDFDLLRSHLEQSLPGSPA